MSYRSLLIIVVLLLSRTVAVTRSVGRPPEPPKQQVERIAAANPDVVLSVCLDSGTVSVRVWDHKQVRVRAGDGLPIELRRPSVAAAEPAKELTVSLGERSWSRSACIRFGDIELDVPREASLKLQTREADVSVSGVARAYVVTQGGSVNVQGVTRFVDVMSIGGNVSVRDSKGAIKLHSVGGSIDAHDLTPGAASDICDASTVGGDIALAQISHGQVRVSTVSGGVSFSSPLAPGGRYSFHTIGGNLSMSLPANSSFRLNATLGVGGEVASDFSLRSSSAVADQTDPFRRRGYSRHVDAIYGTGDSLITLSSFGGSVQLRKK